MRTIVLAMLLAGCTPANYTFNFDLTDPGAQNIQKPGQHDTLEDADLKSEILVDATSFQAIMFELTNKTDAPITIAWDQISLLQPDRTQVPLHPDTGLGGIEAGAKLSARLVPFSLPSVGAAARAFDGLVFELIVPANVRGVPRELHYHLIAHAVKL